MDAKELILAWMEQNDDEIQKLSKELFDHPELAEEEYYAVEVCSDFLSRYGFSVVTGEEAGHPTAFRAEWGTGKPVIGFFAEYDALPALGQVGGSAARNPISGPGHGCGHNLLGTGCIAAACALKYALEQLGMDGTVVCYGTPAEEIMLGKIEMLHKGHFRELDAALYWHPHVEYISGMFSWMAIDIFRLRYTGITAHAAAEPWRGRSALDAAEITNVGVQYMREHLPDGVRMHYVYTNGGEKPNIVPDAAELYYFVRASSRELVEDTTARVLKCAKGAAMMTDTEVSCTFEKRGYETIPNHHLATRMEEVLKELGPPAYTPGEMEFAVELGRQNGVETGGGMNTTVLPTFSEVRNVYVSSDFSDVTWVVPSICINTATWPIGTPGHHWTVTAASGSSVGHKGMIVAAKAMAICGFDLIHSPALLSQAREEFQQRMQGREWKYLG